MKTINPYLIFNGNAEEAFEFYQTVFGGEIFKMRFSEMPGTSEMPDEDQTKLAHVALTIAGKDQILMASDSGTGHEATMQENGNYYLSLEPESAEEAEQIYNKLSDGGKVIMPLDETDWAEKFAMFADKFGIQWMINYGDK
ncbi:VOC family protein [Rhodohalobacter sp. SW132]|uniref:VOC family protein n=1 Tax=Rhodohalobacter sp. SW132 TaxID=2293433 RepID=UPI000E25CA73|nr:VOC family protein [Rhodohalobacter sp. SW132]REL24032.1 VOC family protein [Rhodohalobacter sp. SW132]